MIHPNLVGAIIPDSTGTFHARLGYNHVHFYKEDPQDSYHVDYEVLQFFSKAPLGSQIPRLEQRPLRPGGTSEHTEADYVYYAQVMEGFLHCSKDSSRKRYDLQVPLDFCRMVSELIGPCPLWLPSSPPIVLENGGSHA